MTLKLHFLSVLLVILCVTKVTLSDQTWTIDVGNVDIGYDDSKGVLQMTRIPSSELQEASCYEYILFSRFNTSEVLARKQFCYPSLIIMGHFKYSPSVIFPLVSRAVNVNTTKDQELCVHGNLMEYWNNLPGLDYGNGHLLSGCLSLQENAWMATALRRPRTSYIVVMSDYSEGDPVPSPVPSVESTSACNRSGTYLRLLEQLWTFSTSFTTLVVAGEDLKDNLQSTVNLLTSALKLSFAGDAVEAFRKEQKTQSLKSHNYTTCDHNLQLNVRDSDGQLTADLTEIKQSVSEDLRGKDLWLKIASYRKRIDSLML